MATSSVKFTEETGKDTGTICLRERTNVLESNLPTLPEASKMYTF